MFLTDLYFSKVDNICIEEQHVHRVPYNQQIFRYIFSMSAKLKIISTLIYLETAGHTDVTQNVALSIYQTVELPISEQMDNQN